LAKYTYIYARTSIDRVYIKTIIYQAIALAGLKPFIELYIQFQRLIDFVLIEVFPMAIKFYYKGRIYEEIVRSIQDAIMTDLRAQFTSMVTGINLDDVELSWKSKTL